MRERLMFAFGSLLQAFASWFDDEEGREANQVRQVLLDFARIDGIAALLPTVLFDPAWYRAR